MTSEKEFQGNVIEAAKWNRWKVYHTFDSRRSEPGFPDLVLVRGGRVIFAELKTDDGHLSDAQAKWIAALGNVALASGGSVYSFVWRPREWDAILAILHDGDAPTDPTLFDLTHIEG